MNTAVTSRLSRWVAAFIAVALVAGGSILVTAPASAAPATVTGGSLDWGVAADYRAIFATRAVAGGAAQTAGDTFTFPAATSSTYDPATKSGTLNFTGNARIGYFAGAPMPGVASGNYFYISNPTVTISGTTGTISGQTAGDSHSTNPELPKAALANRTVATLDLAGVAPTVNPEGTLITFAAVPTAITAEGAATLATFVSAGDAAAGKRAVGSALDPLTIQLAIVAQPVAVATTTTLTAPASAVVGAPVALSATVAPATAVGSVEFFDGATSLGSAPVASGVASTSVTLAAGAHSTTARFVPADAALFATSTSAASVVTVTAAPVVTTPTVVVSKTSVVDAGEIVTVTGAGFSPVGTTTNAARPPLAGKFGGVYVSFGKFATVWKASEGANSAARPVGPGGKWVVNPADVATIGGASAGAVAINADGTFSVQLLVKPGYSGEPATGNYGIYTYPGGGVSYPAFETYTPITFAPTPKVTVSKSTISSAGETVTVTGSGFSPVGTATTAARPPLAGKFGGVYVSFGKFATVWKASEGANSAARPVGPGGKWVVNPADVATIGGAPAGAVAINADGTFSVQLLVKPGYSGEPATGNYGIYTYPGGGVSYPAFETYTPITFSAAPIVTVSKSTNVSPLGETVTVTGTGFAPNAPATSAARPPLAGKFGGVYVAFGKFATVWKPSAGATSAARVTGPGVKWVVDPADVATIGGAPAGAVAINPDGTFTTELVLKPGFDKEPATGNYGVYTYPGGGVSYTPFETFTPVVFAGATATTTTLTAAPVAVTVGGSTTLAAQVTPANAVGTVNFSLGSTALGSVAVAGGTASIPVGDLAAGVQQFTATFVPGNVLNFGGSTGSASVTVAEKTVGAGSLTWGIKQSFREYVAGPIAKGTITTSGVGASAGIFTFGQAAGGNYDRATGVGTSAYSGSVRFSGHAGLLDVSIANPVVRVDSPTQGTLLVSVNGGAAMPFASLNLAAASRSTPNNTVSYSGVPAVLTAQGASVFALNGSGFYEAGTPLDSLSFVIGAPNVISSIGATVASFKAPNKAAATPPATTGIEIAQGTSLTAGDEVTITASGFQPNETGILVVIYSTPTVLDTNAKADAAGVVTWTGRLPAGLSGLHTLTFQGSVDRGVELNIAAAAETAVVGCVVDDATLTWGFKESFRAYISGAIAKGEWTVADGATYAVPNFGWSAGAGGYDAETGEGSLAFAGSIAFTGHGGVLNTVVSNPQVKFVDATTGVLLLDISGTTQDGAAIDNKAVEFAALDLTDVVENDEGSVTITAAPATLTAAGSAAFGTYPEGEGLDPVTLAFSTAADCAVEEEAPTPISATADDEVVPVSTTADLTWIIWAAIALLVIVAAVVTVVVVRRRKK